MGVTYLAMAAYSVEAVNLPDYRWGVSEQSTILTPQMLELAESVSIVLEGLTFAANGDLLMAACCPATAKTYIMRSADCGRTWARQGVFDHRDPPKDFFNHGGSVEGVIDWNSVGSGKGMIDWNG